MWTKEGPVFFKWNNDTRLHSVKGLNEGGFMLEISVKDVESCCSSYYLSGVSKLVSKIVATTCITKVSSFDILNVNCRSLIKDHLELN